MFGISGFELLIIAVFVMIIFGPDKLPELAKRFGKAMNTFKKAQNDMEKIIRAEMLTAPSSNSGAGSGKKAAVVEESDEDEQVSETVAAESAKSAWSSTEEDDEEEEEE